MSQNRRTTKLVEPYKQLRFGIMFLLLNFMFSLLILAVFGYFIWDIFSAVSSYFQLDPEQSLMVAKKFLFPVAIGSCLLIAFIFSTLYLSMRYTHQIYGPLISIRRFIDDLIASRDPEPIRLRQSDQLHDLVNRLNQLSGRGFNESQNRSIENLVRFVESLLHGHEGKMKELPSSDPLYPLSAKLQELANLLRSKK